VIFSSLTHSGKVHYLEPITNKSNESKVTSTEEGQKDP